jgi:hypothetical protein
VAVFGWALWFAGAFGGEFSADASKRLRDHGIWSVMSNFERSLFVWRRVFRDPGAKSAENSPVSENSPSGFGHLGRIFMIPERFLRACRKLSVVTWALGPGCPAA